MHQAGKCKEIFRYKAGKCCKETFRYKAGKC